MKRTSTKTLVTAALMVALGLILPYVTGHAFGIQGTVLLPMHLPVLLCGLLCGPVFGAASGIVIPLLSSLLTGMPPAFPMLPIMTAQLFVMGLTSGLLYGRLQKSSLTAVRRFGMYPSLVAASAAGWLAYAAVFQSLVLAGNSLRALSATAAIVQGVPGLAVQLLVVPAIVLALRRAGFARPEDQPVRNAVWRKAKGMVRREGPTCVVMQGEAIVHTADGRGVSPLLKLYDRQPHLLQDACVADLIIGKAAAMILVLGGARMVYGSIMSEAGRQYLESRGVEAQYGRCVDMISNRSRTGICPIENAVWETDDAEEGLERIRRTVSQLMQAAV